LDSSPHDLQRGANIDTSLVLTLNLSAADPNNDMLGLIIFFFDFFIFTVIGIAVFNRIANAKAVKLWPKLAPVINGTFHKGIGLTAPYIVGQYHGLPVRAHVRVFARSKYNFEYYFEISATVDKHGHDWELLYNERSHQKQGWEIKTKDSTFQQRLSQSGLMGVIPGWDHNASVKYNGRKGTLIFSHHIYTRDGLPTPEVFEMQLETLKKMVNINKQVNEDSSLASQFNI
jgi:hypothetical protein